MMETEPLHSTSMRIGGIHHTTSSAFAGACLITAVAGLGLGGCSSAEPTAEMTRSANLVLGQSAAQGTKRLGECLKAGGYEVDPAKVAGNVKRGKDISLKGRSERIYEVGIDGPTKLNLVVAYDSGFVTADTDKDTAQLASVGCELGGG